MVAPRVLAVAPALAGAGSDGSVDLAAGPAECTFTVPPGPALCDVAQAGFATIDRCDATGCVVRVVAEARGRAEAEVPWTLVGHANMDYTGGNYCRTYATATDIACSGVMTMRADASPGECSEGTVLAILFETPFKFLSAEVRASVHLERAADGSARLGPGPC